MVGIVFASHGGLAEGVRDSVTMVFGKSPVVIATLVAIFLNVTLPQEKGRVKRGA